MIILFNDIHIHNEDTVKYLEQILSNKADMYVCMGDLFDRLVSYSVQLKVAELLYSVNAPVYLMVGNHEYRNNYSLLDLYRYIKNVTVVNSTTLLSNYIIMIPFMNHKNMIDDMIKFNNSNNVLLTHCYFDILDIAKYSNRAISHNIVDKYRIVISGDYHEPYTYRNIIYPGACRVLSRNEIGKYRNLYSAVNNDFTDIKFIENEESIPILSEPDTIAPIIKTPELVTGDIIDLTRKFIAINNSDLVPLFVSICELHQ